MKYIDVDRLKVEIKMLEKAAHKFALGCADSETRKFHQGKDFAYQLIGILINSLQQEPLIHTELCTLIACDVIQATAKRAIEKPQDKDKEEDLMVKKMEYLNMLEKSFSQQEQKEFNILSNGSGAWGTTPPKFKLDVKEQLEGLEEFRKEVIKFSQDHFEELHGDMDTIDIVRIIARHFAEWGAEHTKQKPELVQHPAISYMYNADVGRGEQMKQAILALLKSDLIQVAGRGFTKTELIEWVETRPAEIKEDKNESTR